MIKMKDLSIEALEEYLISLIVQKQQTDDVIKKIKEIYDSISEDESVDVNFTHDGKNLRIIVKIINNTQPKCWIEGSQYKFNFFIAHIFDFQTERDKAYAIV